MLRLNKTPVWLPFRPVVDPSADDLDLFGLELLVGIRRRHDVVGTVSDKAIVEGAIVGLARYHNGIVPAFAEEALLGVESQVRLTGAGIGTVAMEAGVREDGPHVAVERERSIGALEARDSDEGRREQKEKFPDHG